MLNLGRHRGGGGSAQSGAIYGETELPDMIVGGAWGLRKLVANWEGALVRIRDTSDNSEQDVGFDGSGDLAAFSVVGTAKVATIYDQSGNGNDLTAPSNATQPTLSPTGGANGGPCVQFPGRMRSPAGVQGVMPFLNDYPTWIYAFDFDAGTGGFQAVTLIPNVANGWTSPFYRFGNMENGANLEFRSPAGISFGITNAANYVLIIDASTSGAVDVYRNGTVSPNVSQAWTGPAVFPNSTRIRLGSEDDGGGSVWNGKWYELVALSGGTLTGTQRSAAMDYLIEKWQP